MGVLGMRMTVAAVLAAFLAGGWGCASEGTVPRKVTVNLDSGAGLQNFEVHVIGVPAAEASKWESVDVDEYFFGDGELRGDKIEHTFVPGGEGLVIEKNAAIWRTWKDSDAAWLFVLAGLRGTNWEADSRLRRFDIWGGSSEGKRPINVLITDRGLEQQP